MDLIDYFERLRIPSQSPTNHIFSFSILFISSSHWYSFMASFLFMTLTSSGSGSEPPRKLDTIHYTVLGIMLAAASAPIVPYRLLTPGYCRPRSPRMWCNRWTPMSSPMINCDDELEMCSQVNDSETPICTLHVPLSHPLRLNGKCTEVRLPASFFHERPLGPPRRLGTIEHAAILTINLASASTGSVHYYTSHSCKNWKNKKSRMNVSCALKASHILSKTAANRSASPGGPLGSLVPWELTDQSNQFMNLPLATARSWPFITGRSGPFVTLHNKGEKAPEWASNPSLATGTRIRSCLCMGRSGGIFNPSVPPFQTTTTCGCCRQHSIRSSWASPTRFAIFCYFRSSSPIVAHLAAGPRHLRSPPPQYLDYAEQHALPGDRFLPNTSSGTKKKLDIMLWLRQVPETER